jgi:hypothetical protein
MELYFDYVWNQKLLQKKYPKLVLNRLKVIGSPTFIHTPLKI